MSAPVEVTGRVGWRNSVDVRTGSQLDVYGPGGRWGGPVRQGHALIDALVDAGAGEGWELRVTAYPPGTAPQWSCGRCDSFAARGFDDGQIPEHHDTCKHAGVGHGPGEDVVELVAASVHDAVIDRAPWRMRAEGSRDDWRTAVRSALTAAGLIS